MNNVCQLCLKSRDLRLSHIVPRFVFRWQKESAPGGIRTHRNPNLRIQDGPKAYLLCTDCEQKFSTWEKLFCERIFLPLHNPQPVTTPIQYESWALKCAVSISWRVLMFFRRETQTEHFTPLQHQLAVEALETWRKFLLGEVRSPGKFSQHLLPTDVIENYQGMEISPFLNRYLLRNIHLDVICTQSSAYVYTKMCRLILFGHIQEKHPKQWRGMQLRLRKGDIRPRNYILPGAIAEYMNRKADEAKRALESLSPRQYEKVDAEFNKNIDEIAKSEIFRAMSYDVAHSGQKAFSTKKKDRKK